MDPQASEVSRIRVRGSRAYMEQLQDKVLTVASTKSSMAEVSSVYDELQACLGSEDSNVPEGEFFPLLMNAALLTSILKDRASNFVTAEHEEQS
ncbi:hypothetical protein BD410DRAFT_491693 [Rickenella mellea]|uniref:Uncharacterized protein n=1 Tax=Rickenella mellea TaxID=50990 RepID=A0A4Y7PVW2_9AGAM|nr:hypothetical protein BD410DRAFT_491693 [Rickenella mellea]